MSEPPESAEDDAPTTQHTMPTTVIDWVPSVPKGRCPLRPQPLPAHSAVHRLRAPHWLALRRHIVLAAEERGISECAVREGPTADHGARA